MQGKQEPRWCFDCIPLYGKDNGVDLLSWNYSWPLTMSVTDIILNSTTQPTLRSVLGKTCGKKRQSSPSVVRLLHVTVFFGFYGFTSMVDHSVRMYLFHWNVVFLSQFQCIVQVVKRRDVRKTILVDVHRWCRKPAGVCLWRQTSPSVYALLKSYVVVRRFYMRNDLQQIELMINQPHYINSR